MPFPANLRTFRTAQGGNVGVVFAAILLPVIAVVATALDYGHAAKMKSQLAHASEAAAQAVSARLDLDRDTLAKLVRQQLDANLPKDFKDLPFEMSIGADRASIEVSLGTKVPTTLMGIVGVSEVSVSASGYSRRLTPTASAGLDAQVRTPAPGSNGLIESVWRTLWSGGSPIPAALDEAAAAADAARSQAGPPAGVSHSEGETVEFPSGRGSDELRRAARELEAHLRALPNFRVDSLPPDVEKLMHDLGRSR